MAEAVKANSYIERVILKSNSINNKYLTEIDEKTCKNVTEARTKKLPVYKREIHSIVVDEERMDELEWKAEQCKQQREVIAGELEKELGIFEEIRRVEQDKYSSVMELFDSALEEEKSVDRSMEKLKNFEVEIKSSAERSINSLNQKIATVRNKVSQLETTGIPCEFVKH